MVQIASGVGSKKPREIDRVFLLTPLRGFDSFRRKFTRQHDVFTHAAGLMTEAGSMADVEIYSGIASLHDLVDCAELQCAPLLNCDKTSHRNLDRGEV